MKQQYRLTRIAALGALGASVLTLTGCMGPTYGTDKPAMTQFFDDLGGTMRLGKKKKAAIDYKPRPGLVQPSDTSTLPEPQQNIADTSGQWPESPEERLARIRKDADEGKYVSGLARTEKSQGTEKSQETDTSLRTNNTQTVERKTRTAANKQLQSNVRPVAAPGQRIYLTDPPAEYRKPAETAPYGDLGEKESVKERARKKANAEPKTGWRKLVPWL
jgi:hypothetical protein